jgi:hypothetical protein
MEVFLENLLNSFLKNRTKLEPIFIFVKTKDRFSIQFSYVIMSTNFHYENRAKNWVGNQVTIRKSPNTGHNLILGLTIIVGA